MTRSVKIEDLIRIVEMCKIVENKGLDPFEVEVKKSLEKLRDYLPDWKLLDELLIDAEALNRLSSIIKLQADWIKHRSSSLYVDPFIIELKIRVSENKDLAQALLDSWHSIVRIEQISSERLKDAVDYWNTLLPLNERWKDNFTHNDITIGILNMEDLKKLRIITLENFEKNLEKMINELKTKLNGIEQIEYWDYVLAETFEETLKRVYLTSFIVTEDYATMRVDPIEEKTYLIPIDDHERLKKEKRRNSIPIVINYNSWKSFMEKKRRFDRRRNRDK